MCIKGEGNQTKSECRCAPTPSPTPPVGWHNGKLGDPLMYFNKLPGYPYGNYYWIGQGETTTSASPFPNLGLYTNTPGGARPVEGTLPDALVEFCWCDDTGHQITLIQLAYNSSMSMNVTLKFKDSASSSKSKGSQIAAKAIAGFEFTWVNAPQDPTFWPWFYYLREDVLPGNYEKFISSSLYYSSLFFAYSTATGFTATGNNTRYTRNGAAEAAGANMWIYYCQPNMKTFQSCWVNP